VDVYDGSEPLSGGIVACLLRRVTGLPCLVELQGDLLEIEAGTRTPMKELIIRSIARTVVRHADHIRAISDRVASHARRAGVEGSRITIATVRVNMQRFPGRRATGLRDVVRGRYDLGDRKVVGYLGRLHPLKGLRVLVEAWQIVAAKVPDATLVIVGDGPEREYLNRAVARRTNAQIILAGRCHYDEVPAWLDAFDLFVLPSLTEGTPRALLEAMAMELPVVATNVGDIPHTVRDPSTGIIVPPRDAGVLAHAILDLLTDSTKAEQMGRRARAAVVHSFEFGRSIRALAAAHYRAAGIPFPQD
jgi:glycosyltransferase involved in cell wall biosynthesis